MKCIAFYYKGKMQHFLSQHLFESVEAQRDARSIIAQFYHYDPVDVYVTSIRER